MKLYNTRNAMKVFYYLTAIDGDIGDEELKQLDEVGNLIDGEHFNSFKEALMEECRKQITNTDVDDEYYDVLQEATDVALNEKNSEESVLITPRLLLWNLFAVAFSNNKYDTAEKRLIAHIARVSGVDKSIVLEMEQYTEAAKAIQKEKELVQNSTRPYAEIRPIADELEKRMGIIKECAQALIEDEVTLDSPFMYKSDFIDKTKSALANTVREKTKETTASVAKKLNPVVNMVKDKAQGLIKKTLSEIPDKKDKKDKGNT